MEGREGRTLRVFSDLVLMRFNEGVLDDIRSRLDIADVISDYVQLKSSGKNLVGLCPFHQEKTPSFSVSQEKQMYYCFGCGTGGDMFHFLMGIEKIEFPEAVNILAEKAGVELKTENDRQSSIRDGLLETLDLAARYYVYSLKKMPRESRIWRYIAERRISPQIVEKFGLGFAPERWDGLYLALKKKGTSEELMEKAGLIIAKNKGSGYYDRFRNRLIFPIRDGQGRVVGFGGRTINPEDQPKYLNSPETAVFNKGDILYGFNTAKQTIRESKQAIIMEGYMDVVTAHQYGFTNAVASLGTALSERQAQRLSRLADRIVIAYDSDTAGTNATLRGLEIFLNLNQEVYVADFQGDKDPDEFLREQGEKAFQEVLDGALPLVDYRFALARRSHREDTTEGKIAIVREVIPFIQKIRDPVRQAIYTKQIAEELNIAEEAIQRAINSVSVEKKGQGYKNRQKTNNTRGNKEQTFPEGKSGRIAKLTPAHLRAEKDMVAALLLSPDLIEDVKEYIWPEDLETPVYQRILSLIYESVANNISISAILHTTGEEERSHISRMLMEQKNYLDDHKYLQGLVNTLLKHRLQNRVNEIMESIKAFEKNGTPVAENILSEYQHLNRLLKLADPEELRKWHQNQRTDVS